MSAVVRGALLVFAALLPIVNPLGMAPIFADMTAEYDVRMRRTVARRVTLYGMALLVGSLFIGSHVLKFFGVSLAAVQLGGGLVVTAAGWRILNQQDHLQDHQIDSSPSRERILSQAFYPLTLPLTVGPGSISVAITLGSNLHQETHLQLITSALAAVIGIVLIGVAIFSCYRFANEIERWLGPTGASIVIRLSAFILVCIGIQIMFNGVTSVYPPTR